MKTLLYVALGGALGASGRYAIGLIALHYTSGNFYWGTIFVNIVGSILLGVIAAIFHTAWAPSQEIQKFLIVGLLGGFTTFSAFSFEIVDLFEKDRIVFAVAYTVCSFFLSVLGLFAGLRLTRGLFA